MKKFLYLAIIIGAFSCNSNKDPEAENKVVEADSKVTNESSSVGDQSSSGEVLGQWKRTASGQDANKNRVLDDSEIMQLEPGAQDSLDFYKDGKCRVHGMGMMLEGTYAVKMDNGKKKIFVYANDTDKNDQGAMKFEIVSASADKLVVVPPIYEFMLSVYTRVK